MARPKRLTLALCSFSARRGIAQDNSNGTLRRVMTVRLMRAGSGDPRAAASLTRLPNARSEGKAVPSLL